MDKSLRQNSDDDPSDDERVGPGGEITVRVLRSVLADATSRTGIADPAELVTFALALLNQSDPSADLARATRGHLPGFDLDI